tara:strand:- start:1905 stop:3011 length:1107 start_codon:yes stop_codon:yes gene_type:complete
VGNKKVAFVSNNFWTLYKFRYDIIHEIIKMGYSVHLIASRDKFCDKFTHNNIKKHFISLKPRGKFILSEIHTMYDLYRIYRKIKPDLIYHFTIKPNIYGSYVANLLNLKSISFITGLGHLFIKKSLMQRIAIFLYRKSLKNTLEVWFTNKNDLNLFLNENIIDDKITRIVPGAGIKEPEKQSIQKESDIINFTMISRIQREKGISEFLDVARKFKSNKNINFNLLGHYDKSDPSSIPLDIFESYIQDDSIIYHGYQDNITQYLNNTDCLIHPSYREGISTVLLESAINKKLIITTKVPGCIDVIPDSQYGILCDPKSSESLHDAINKYLKLNNRDKEIITNNAYNYVLKNFNRESIINQFKSSLQYIL